MTQFATLVTRTGSIQIELPCAEVEVMQGVRWGAVDAFPTPAYWQCQVLARRLTGRPAPYKLGRTLAEEVGACLVGGHGIPASVCIAAYERLRQLGAFAGTPPSQAQLEAWLRQPLQVGERKVTYRFAAQKARYLAAALPLVNSAPAFSQGKALRDWLLNLPGVGPKTASWVVRNWLDADDVAILDIHIMRIGQAMGVFPRNLTVERHYAQLEELFLQFGAALDVRASELDAVMWYEMASSPRLARTLTDQLREAAPAPSIRRQTQNARPVQLRLTA